MHIPSIPAEIRGAVFDFDGTIMDSMPDWAGKMLNLLNTHHVAYPADIIRTITPLGDGGSARYFTPYARPPSADSSRKWPH